MESWFILYLCLYNYLHPCQVLPSCRELEATGHCVLKPTTRVSVERWDEQNAEGHKMNASSCRHRPVAMYQQSSGADLNGSCDFLAPHGNLTSAAATLQLPTFTTAAKVRVIVTFILCGISTFCNLVALWAVNGQKRKSHVRVLIINLTVADLLVTFIVMPVDAVWNITVQWVASDLACRILMFLKLQAMYSCAFVTVVISLDRQFAILNPLAIIMARRRNKVMLTVAWTMSAVLSIPQVRSKLRTPLWLQTIKQITFDWGCIQRRERQRSLRRLWRSPAHTGRVLPLVHD